MYKIIISRHVWQHPSFKHLFVDFPLSFVWARVRKRSEYHPESLHTSPYIFKVSQLCLSTYVQTHTLQVRKTSRHAPVWLNMQNYFATSYYTKCKEERNDLVTIVYMSSVLARSEALIHNTSPKLPSPSSQVNNAGEFHDNNIPSPSYDRRT